MDTKEKRLVRLAVGIIFFGVVVLSIYNFHNNENFLDTSIATCISIVVAVGISYLLSQRQTDKRKQKDILLNLLSAIQTLIGEREAYVILHDTDPKSLTMRKRDISNRLEILKQHKNRFGISNEVDFVLDRFSEYEELIGSHDIAYLSESEKELKRPLELIDNKLFEIMLKIYT